MEIVSKKLVDEVKGLNEISKGVSVDREQITTKDQALDTPKLRG